MTQSIAHFRHVGPRDLGIGVGDIGRHRLGCLTDDLEAAFDGATRRRCRMRPVPAGQSRRSHLPPQSCRPGGGRRIGSQRDGVASDLVVSFEKRPERDDVDIDAQQVTERLLEMDQIQK